jgi:signal transduction histidine kinase
VFFLRSIRRRLVTGYTVALTFFLLMAIAAIWGLMRHQEAVARLENFVHNSPDRARLETAITRLQLPFVARIDLTQDQAVGLLQQDLLSKVEAVRQQRDEFYRRSLDAAQDPQFFSAGFVGQGPLLSRTMEALDANLAELKRMAENVSLDLQDPMTRIRNREAIELAVARRVAVMNNALSRLPEHYKQTYVETSLIDEQRESTRVLKNVFILSAVALVSYAVTITLGFWWISNPLRAIARGAARIANGDTDYRLGQVTPWKDEFFDLTENFNRMADRFKDSEDDLSAQVEERSRQLVRSERLADIGFLATGVAHEINSPLQSMLNAAESIQYRLMDHLDPDDPDTEIVHDRLGMITRESKRCGQITRRLLDFSHTERQGKQRDDLTRVIVEVLAMIRPMSAYKDRKLIFEHSAPVLIEINSGEMKQVVLNLVSNALQATGSGGTVEIELRELTDWVVLIVRDDGHGMTADNIQNLFEPFYTTKETGVGTGLGLSITHRIVQEHHGTIDPRSDGPGKGSTFQVRLPKKQPNRQAA